MTSTRIASHLMAAVGLATLASTGRIAAPLLIAGGCGVLASLAVDALRIERRIPAALLNSLILLALGVAIAEYLWTSHTLLHVGAHLLVLLMFTRLRHADAREYLQFVVIVFLQVLASAGLTSNSAFAVWFAAYLVVMVWVLMQYHAMEEAERSPAAEPCPGLGRWAVTAALGALIVTGLLFVSLPRMGFGLLAATPPADVQLIGFAPQVEVGSLGSLKRDPTVVMRVSGETLAENPLREPLYLRGAVFDAFNGRSWLNTAPVRRSLPLDGERRFVLERVQPRFDVYTVKSEPIDVPVIFTPSRTAAVAGPFSAVTVDDQRTFAMPYATHARTTYQIWQRPAAQATPESEGSSERMERYLVVDGSARLARLARETAGENTPAAQAKAIERFLKRHYAYTLDVPAPVGAPIDDFLFRRRSGFCEHFASAMVLMLRAVGIPSRLVNGFLVQEWNEYGAYYLVRQGDAHAWVEAYLPERGWVRFDPTPSGLPADRPWTGSVEHYLDHLRSSWDRYVVEFGLGDQSDALQRIEREWEAARNHLTAWGPNAAASWRTLRDAAAGGWPIALVAVGLLGIAALGWRRWRHGRPRGHTGGLRVEFYARLLRALAGRGVSKPESSTPWEFTTGEAAGLPWIGEIRHITGCYYRIRYGGEGLAPAERQAIERALAMIERAPKI
ncbi:MAG: transglutaminaseTgpA domain-containing protein [Nitrospiria bacterium]